ncbi:DNA ligase 1 isoform X1 [Polyergus mexicanus]|uniref:DNA ligase 1 isoform X1 n=1 Tax=Polyergus mexicanus TaxID=615972 RepID=UPI0038B4FD33
MSTIGVSTRSSRLNSRELCKQAASGRKLKSKKIITINKSLQKINISARDKSLHVSKTNMSANNSQPLSRRLRPRRNKKNYCEDSKLLQQYIPLKQQDSVVILEKLTSKNNEKVPIYKAMKSFEKSLENKNDVYDFMFDINDTMEKATKKKQIRKINKKKNKMTKKITHKKVTVQSKIIGNKKNESCGLDTNPAKYTQSNPSESAIELIVTESAKKDKQKIEIPRTVADVGQIVEELEEENTVKKIASSTINTDIEIIRESVEEETEKKIETPRTNTDIDMVGETSLPSNKVCPKQIKIQETKKPKIISVENADNITVIKSAPSNTEEFWPFRSKNIFDNKTSVKQQKNTLNCSLLTKSLSPILKTTSALDVGSPWRPPTLSLFSQTKHFIQSSTPKLKFENNKENMEINKENIEMSKENMKINKESMEIDKENMENKKNKCGREKERKKKMTFHKKHDIIQRKLPINQTPEKVQAIDTSKHVQAVPARISLGEIKNLLQTKSDINDDNKQATDQMHVEVDKSFTKQKDKNLVNFLSFSDTFDVLSETERLSNVEAEVPLFMDLEPSHFSKPPQHSYRRKRAVKFDFVEDISEEEEQKENMDHHTKKKKLTKFEKENEKRVNEWIKTINSTFEEIDEYNLLIE